jgi:DNA-binding XRE family transcriptional regulator
MNDDPIDGTLNYSYLEKGTYNPSLDLAHKVAKTLRTTIDVLFVFEVIYKIGVIF